MRQFASALLAIVLFSTLGYAADSGRYGNWQGGQTATKSLSSELRALISEAEKARAADPRFLQDLKDLVARYDNPWQVRILEEDFKDGDFKSNPTWTVVSGRFGMGWEGLLSTVQPQQAAPQQQQQSQKMKNRDLAIALLGQMLNQGQPAQQQQEQPAPPAYEPAEIYLSTRVSNSFSMAMDVTGRATAGGVDFVLFQGNQRSAGYRLSATPGRGVQLLKVSSRGTVTLADSGPSVNLGDGKKHQILWRRAADGGMSLAIDGKTLFNVTDQSFKQAFDGFSMVNKGGELTLHRLTIDGTS